MASSISVSSSSSAAIYSNRAAASLKPLLNSSQLREFTRRLPPATIDAIEAKWKNPGTHQLAQTLVKELKEHPYKTDIFFHDEIEFIALYAASENMSDAERLTVFEISNILSFREACRTYGREKVQVHFLSNNEEEKKIFRGSAAPIFTYRDSGYADDKPIASPDVYGKWLDAPLEKLTLPPHQMVFFTVPENENIPRTYEECSTGKQTIRQRVENLGAPFIQAEVDGSKRRMIVTHQLFQDYFKALIPLSGSQVNPVLGASTSLDYEDFSHRDAWIPFSLDSIPAFTDSLRTGGALNFRDHDLFHAMIDMCNLLLPAFQELCPLVKEAGPYVFERYLDRNVPAYRFEIAFHGPETPFNKTQFFWSGLSLLFASGTGCLVSEKILQKIVEHIGDNSSRWEKEHGITLQDLLRDELFSWTSPTVNTFQELARAYLAK